MEQTKLCTKCKTEPRAPSYFRCRACLNEQHRAWCNANPDKVKTHKRSQSDYYAQYYERNKDRLSSYLQSFYQENPHAKTTYRLNRKAKKHGKAEKLKPPELLLFLDTHPVCETCGHSDERNLTVTHRFPLIYKPSRNDVANLIRECKSCAKARGFKLHPSIFADDLAEIYQFAD